MKTIRLILSYCIAATFAFSVSSCSKSDENTDNEVTYLLNGTWRITSEDWKGLVVFDKEEYRIEEYCDERGYGFYTYKGNFYGTIKYWSEQIDLFSSESKGWLGEDGYVSHIIGKSWKMPSKITDDMIIYGKDGKEYHLIKITGTTNQRSDIYGVWKFSDCTGSVYTCVNGQKGVFLQSASKGSLVRKPKEIGITQSTLKSQNGYNAYIISDNGNSSEKVSLAKMTFEGQRILMSDSDYSWLSGCTWEIVSVNENELRISIEGPDGGNTPDYLELILFYKRVKTL